MEGFEVQAAASITLGPLESITSKEEQTNRDGVNPSPCVRAPLLRVS